MQPWFDSFASAIADGEPRYRLCTECETPALPPRQLCPECHTPTLESATLSPDASVVSFTKITSTIPQFLDETPYTIVLASFDEGVRLTGWWQGNSYPALGDTVQLDAVETDDNGWLLTFEPTE